MKKRTSDQHLLVDAIGSAPKRTPQEVAELLLKGDISGYDMKLILNTISEMYETAKLMEPLRGVPKITVFGSARTKEGHPNYEICKNFCKMAADVGYMIITGAGHGIMGAAPHGAGAKNSIGVSVELPYERGVTPYLEGSDHIITYKYFFNRKLTFIREADAVVIFPGGFGSMDEAFEVLTLLHTGRTMPVPLVFVEHEDGDYWQGIIKMITDTLDANNMIDEDDLYLYRHFKSAEEALGYINNFYRVYHSLRFVGQQVVVRLNEELPAETLTYINEKYADYLGPEGLKPCSPLEVEQDEPDLLNLPRLVMSPDLTQPNAMYCLIRDLNRQSNPDAVRKEDTNLHELPAPKRPNRIKVQPE